MDDPNCGPIPFEINLQLKRSIESSWNIGFRIIEATFLSSCILSQ